MPIVAEGNQADRLFADGGVFRDSEVRNKHASKHLPNFRIRTCAFNRAGVPVEPCSPPCGASGKKLMHQGSTRKRLPV